MNLVACKGCGCVMDWDFMGNNNPTECPGCMQEIDSSGWSANGTTELGNVHKKIHDAIHKLLPEILLIEDTPQGKQIKPEAIMGFTEKMGDMDARLEQIEIDMEVKKDANENSAKRI